MMNKEKFNQLCESVKKNGDDIKTILKMLRCIYQYDEVTDTATITIGAKVKGKGKKGGGKKNGKKYKFIKKDDEYISNVLGREVSLTLIGANRTSYQQFLFEQKSTYRTLQEYDKVIDHTVKMTQEIQGLETTSEANEFLGMKEKNLKVKIKGKDSTWKERTVNVYKFDLAKKTMTPVMNKNGTKHKTNNITSFIGKKWTKNQILSKITSDDKNYEKNKKLIEKAKRINEKYNKMKIDKEKEVDKIMEELRKKISHDEFKKRYPLWVIEPEKQKKDVKKTKKTKKEEKQKREYKNKNKSSKYKDLDEFPEDEEEETDELDKQLDSVLTDDEEEEGEEDSINFMN